MFTVLFLGDIVGRPGRDIVKKLLPQLKREHKIDYVIANGENAAHGTGLTRDVAQDLFDAGIDLLTGGNHIWDKKEIFDFIDEWPRVLRPVNYPPGTPGSGVFLTEVGSPPVPFAVINAAGRTFMHPLDCPFRGVDAVLAELPERTLAFVDFHAEATSEKVALGFHLDGRVAAVVGTHTHIQTADERLLPKGTAYITDAGMCGPYISVLGVEVDTVVKRFMNSLPTKFTLADGPSVLNGVLFWFNLETRQAARLPERIAKII